MPKFSTHVALMSPDFHAVGFGPGDEVPEWALSQVGAHVLEPEGDADAEPDTEEDSESGEAPDDNEADDEGEESTPASDVPDFTAPTPARRGRPRKQ